MIKIGIIGLDTSHSVQFTRSLNQPEPPAKLSGCQVVAAYPHGSADIPSSRDRIPGYTAQLRQAGITIAESEQEVIEAADVVLLETNDGRLRIPQLLPVLQAGKPVFADKPVAGSLADVIVAYRLAEHFQTPIFTSSALRFSPGLDAIRQGELGEILACDTFSPCPVEPTHPDLFWYGIHGIELLITVMGVGCVELTRMTTPTCDFITGKWEDGRIGTYRGRRTADGGYLRGFGGTVFGSLGIRPVGQFLGYEFLLEQIVQFFKTGIAPVSAEETLSIYTMLEAADVCKTTHDPVNLAEYYQAAAATAEEKLTSLIS